MDNKELPIQTFKSDLSGIEFPMTERVSAKSVRSSILNVIQKDLPNFNRDHFLSQSELNLYREKAISDYLTSEVGELSEDEKTVLKSINSHKTLSDKLDDEDEKQKLTLGQRVADKVAAFGGSWIFIISFLAFMTLWIVLNIYWLGNKGFDPYPFILLNLILSCLAALQAPVIMMSQNRQEEKDRDRAKNDYMINLKSELEIRILHEKLDHFIMDEQQELLEMQRTQIQMLHDIIKNLEQR